MASQITVEFVGDVAKLKQAMGQVEDRFESTRRRLNDIGNRMSVAVTLPIAAAAVKATALAGALNEQISAANTVFGENAARVQAWSKTTADAFGVARTEALQAATGLFNFIENSGVAAGAATDMSTEVVELAGDMASFHDADPSDMLERLRSGLAGEVEPLRQFGVNLSAAAVDAKAMEMGLVDANGEVTEGGKVQARYALLVEETSRQQGDFARTADDAANKQRRMAARAEDAAAAFGQKLLPAKLKVLEVGTRLLDRFEELTGEQQNLAIAVAGVAAAIGPLAKAGAGLITVIKGISVAMTFLAAHPVVAVIAGVAALVAGLMVLYRTNDKVRRFVDHVWSNIVRIVANAVVAIIEKLRGWMNTAFDVLDKILAAAIRVFRILAPNVADRLERMRRDFKDFREGANEQLDKVKDTVEVTAKLNRRNFDKALERLDRNIKVPRILNASIRARVDYTVGDGYGIGGRPGGGLLGISPFSAVGMAYTSMGRPGDVISGLRPGARTLSGNLSYHARGRALDLTPSLSVALQIIRRFGARTKELITPWPGIGLYNGRPHRFSDAVQAQHDGRTNVRHLHWAMGSGAYVKRPTTFEHLTMAEKHPEVTAPVPMLDQRLDAAFARHQPGAVVDAIDRGQKRTERLLTQLIREVAAGMVVDEASLARGLAPEMSRALLRAR